jgi:hypothetical protein
MEVFTENAGHGGCHRVFMSSLSRPRHTESSLEDARQTDWPHLSDLFGFDYARSTVQTDQARPRWGSQLSNNRDPQPAQLRTYPAAPG